MENYKYDVAISFAEEDKDIAEKISGSLKDVGLSPYFYKDETAENWGENLFNIITVPLWDSSTYLLPLAIDGTKVDGITDNILTVK